MSAISRCVAVAVALSAAGGAAVVAFVTVVDMTGTPAHAAWAQTGQLSVPMVVAAEHAKPFKNAMPWSSAEGKPAFEAGRTDGFYIWHEGNSVTIATTTEAKRSKQFTGRVVVHGGTIGTVGGGNLEKKDRLEMPKPNVLKLKFRTDRGLDQVTFTVNGGDHIEFELGEQLQAARHVFFGSKAEIADRHPLIFDLSK